MSPWLDVSTVAQSKQINAGCPAKSGDPVNRTLAACPSVTPALPARYVG
jgi:hypothetical protein